MSHGFGGITGRVRLVSCDPVFVSDTYVQNTPAITDVNVIATVTNTSGKADLRNLRVTLADKADLDHKLPLAFDSEQKNVNLAPGEKVQTRVGNRVISW